MNVPRSVSAGWAAAREVGGEPAMICPMLDVVQQSADLGPAEPHHVAERHDARQRAATDWMLSPGAGGDHLADLVLHDAGDGHGCLL